MHQCQDQVSAPLELELREQVQGLPGMCPPAQPLREPCLQWNTAAVAGVVGGWGRGQDRVTEVGTG